MMWAGSCGLYAQSHIDEVLKSIEAHNKELQANAQRIASQKLEAQTENNLPDPTLSYAHLWARKASTSPASTPPAAS